MEHQEDRTYNYNDCSASRVRFDRYCVLNKELFKKFKEEYPENPLGSDWETFKASVIAGNRAMARVIIKERRGIELPSANGRLSITSYRPSAKVVDRRTSLDNLKKIYTKNYDTDGLVCKIKYSIYNRKYTPNYKRLWAFSGCRELTRNVSEAFVKNPHFYLNPVEKDDYSRDYRTYKNRTQADSSGYVAD